MGILDGLKKLLPKSEPFPWDPASVRHMFFTLRLPQGWRFTHADLRSASAVGPAEQKATFHFSVSGGARARLTAEQVERLRPKIFEMMRGYLKYSAKCAVAPTESVLPNGVLWAEASEVKGAERRLHLYVVNPLPRVGEGYASPSVYLTTATPLSSEAFGAERLQALRAMMRGIEWN